MMLGAAILNYRTPTDAIELALLLAGDPRVHHIAVVDNDSPDNSRPRLIEALSGESKVRLVLSEENCGYSAGNMLAIEELRRLGCRRVLVINPDVRLQAGCLESLERCLDRGHTLVSPTLLKPDGSVDAVGGAWDPLLGRGLVLRSAGERTPKRAVRTFSGACFLADLSTIDLLGGLPTRYFLYGEETHMVMQLRRHRMSWMVDPHGVAVHARGTSLGSSSEVDRRSEVSVRYSAESAVLLTASWWPMCLLSVVLARAAFALRLVVLGRRDLGMAALSGLRSGLQSIATNGRKREA